MNNKVRLSQASLIVALAIILALMTVYVPMLGILSLAIPVPYAIIGAMTNSKYSILSVIVTFIALMISVDPIYSINTCIMGAIPGIFIGYMSRKNIEQSDNNKFEPVYGGTIAFVISIIVFFFVSKIIFNINLIEEFMGIMKESINQQMNIMKSVDLKLVEGLKPEDLVNYVRNMLPTMLLFQGMVMAFVTYYLEVFILKRIRRSNLQMPKIADFYLPGNAIGTSFMLYLFVLLLEIMNVNLHTDLIMINLQLVFNFMFIAQGISVCVYYIKKWMRKGPNKIMLLSGIVLFISGFMGISFLGMLDSIIDFRKVRSYKST